MEKHDIWTNRVYGLHYKLCITGSCDGILLNIGFGRGQVVERMQSYHNYRADDT